MAQGLAYAVHLIVVPAVWKREKLIFEISKPWSLLREEHLTVLELGGLDAMRIFLSYSGLTGMTEKFALRRRPDCGIFNQDLGGLMQLCVLRYLRFQAREVEPAA